ncbi:MAG: FtsX-like permease family protein [Actinobacteria bacterium]|nr:FtsX-like permease family protein [Actinomycetota bacterium]
MRLAFREILRTKLRFSLLAGAVGLLVFLILFQSTLLSTLLSFFSGALESQSAAVVVYSDDARRNPEGSVLPLTTVDEVAAVPGVAAAGPFGVDTMTARAGGEELDVALLGYELGGPGAPTTLVEGRLPNDDNEGVASDIDADRGFAIGDTVRIVGPEGTYPIEIVGLAENARFSVQPGVFVSYDTFEAASRVKNPDAIAVLPSMVLADPESGLSASTVADRITRQVDGVEALTRSAAVNSLPGVSAVKSSFNIIQGLAFIVVTLVVGIFFVILTVQKAAALTLLRAIGASSGELVRSLLVQVLIVMAGAIVVGAALMFVASLASTPDFPISFDLGIVVSRGAALVVLALIASLAAIRRVLRIDPIAATVPAGVDR